MDALYLLHLVELCCFGLSPFEDVLAGYLEIAVPTLGAMKARRLSVLDRHGVEWFQLVAVLAML